MASQETIDYLWVTHTGKDSSKTCDGSSEYFRTGWMNSIEQIFHYLNKTTYGIIRSALIQAMANKFIWKNGKPRIKTDDNMQTSKENGKTDSHPFYKVFMLLLYQPRIFCGKSLVYPYCQAKQGLLSVTLNDWPTRFFKKNKIITKNSDILKTLIYGINIKSIWLSYNPHCCPFSAKMSTTIPQEFKYLQIKKAHLIQR